MQARKCKQISLSILALLCGVFSPTQLFASQVPAGVETGHVWFSKDPFFAGDTITVFALVYNSTGNAMSGVMNLYDGTTTISTRSFRVAPLGSSSVVAFPWTVTPGNHALSAVITKTTFASQVGTAVSQADVLEEATTTTEERFADYDRNKNGIADSTEPPSPSPPKVTAAGSDDPQSETLLPVMGSIPAPLRTPLTSAENAAEHFRIGEAERITAHIDALKSTIVTNGGKQGIGFLQLMNEGVKDRTLFKTPFTYALLFCELMWRMIVAHPLVYYVLLLLILLKILHTIFRFFF